MLISVECDWSRASDQHALHVSPDLTQMYRCAARVTRFSSGVKAFISALESIHYAILPAFIALILLATPSLAATVLHLPQLLRSVCVRQR